jgi:hypothetical protein
MKKARGVLYVAAILGPPCLGIVDLTAQGQDSNPSADSSAEISRKLEDLQNQVNRLQAELTQARKQLGESPEGKTATAGPTETTLAATTSAATGAPPEPEEKKSTLRSILGATTLSGFVDGYYGINFNHPQSRTSPYRVFDAPANQFSLNQAQIMIDKAPDASNSRLGYRLAFGYGNAMNVVNSTDNAGAPGFAQYLKEAYFSYLAPVGKNGLQFDFGKFVTPHGGEVIESKDNWNYSRGILFGYAIPFYHFGLRTKYTFNSQVALSGFVVNGWDNVVDNNTAKTYGVTLSLNPHKRVSISQGYMMGPETTGTNQGWRQLTDTVVTISATDKLTFMVNYDYGRGDSIDGFSDPAWWTGWAGYMRYAVDDRHALAFRYEWFNDPLGFRTGTAQQLKEFTGTFEKRVATRLITRLEYRHDYSNQPTFVKGDSPVRAQDTVAAGLIYVFDSRE